MSLSCNCEYDDAPAWYYDTSENFSILDTKRSRKCCSCGVKLPVGSEVLRFRRWRPTTERCNYIEESIYGDEVPLAPWYMCETCGGLYMAVQDLNMCCDISENIANQIKEYNAQEACYKSRSLKK
jgi:hypothetical protein